MPLTTNKTSAPNNANQVIQSFKPELFMLFCQINQPQQNLLSVIAQLPVKETLNPHYTKSFPKTPCSLERKRPDQAEGELEGWTLNLHINSNQLQLYRAGSQQLPSIHVSCSQASPAHFFFFLNRMVIS